MKTKIHSLRVDEGHLTVENQTTWPDIVKVSIPKHIVLNMLARLSSSLQDSNEKEIELTFMGKLDYDIQE